MSSMLNDFEVHAQVISSAVIIYWQLGTIKF